MPAAFASPERGAARVSDAKLVGQRPDWVPPPLSTPSRPFRDVVLYRVARPLERQLGAVWGGTYTASNGQRVTIYASDRYRVDVAWHQEWAEWLARYLFYNFELQTAVFLFVPPSDMAAACQALAYGCYAPSLRLIVVPGNDFPDGMSRATVISHEYGHHVAANRDNSPWPALLWGPKRWASYAGVCQRVASGTAVPKDRGSNYALDPGEVFAETYAKAVHRGGNWLNNWWPDWPWEWDQSFAPDSSATALAAEDAATPWLRPTDQVWAGRLSRKVTRKRVRIKGTKRYKTVVVYGAVVPARRIVQTQLDGVLTITIQDSPDASVLLYDDATDQLVAPASRRVITHAICGQRAFDLRLVSSGPGTFSVVISVP